MKDVVIVSCGRSAIGKAPKGSLCHTRPEEYGGQVLKSVLEKVKGIEHDIDDVILGCAMPEAEQGNNIARIVAAKAGLAYSVPGQTVNRFCSSGLQAIASAANGLWAGQYDAVAAGGVESMSLIPMGGEKYLPDPNLLKTNPEFYMAMGHTAERVAKKYGISREEQDAFALESHLKAADAQGKGKFDEETAEVTRLLPDGSTAKFSRDEGIRPQTKIEVLNKLRPAFKYGGSVTAGNSSQMSDGAAFVVMTTGELAKKRGIKPLARFIGYAAAGVRPELMGIGPVEAIPKVLKRSGLSLGDIGLIELNEAFAAQAIACIKELGLPVDKVNVNGGAIALGHPLGCTGAALTVKLIYELRRRGERYGLVSMCIGGGQGAAGIVELLW